MPALAYCRETIRAGDLIGMQDAVEAGWEDDPAYETFELGSYIGGRVLVDGDLYGTLCFAATGPRRAAFSESERTFVELLTQWISYELERRRSTEALRQQNQQLEEFASVVSHDLRNPLNVAQGNLDLFCETGDEARIERIDDALERMNQLIDDVLLLAREGEQVSERESVSLPGLVRERWGSVHTEVGRLEVDLPSESTAEADRSRLKHVFENLFDNAVKYADGDVRIRVGTFERGIFVEDDGPGMSPDTRDRAFESGVTTASSGTGFGLAIVRQIVEAHGWEIEIVESHDGGTRFEIAW